MTAPIPSPIWQPAASRVIPIAAPANLRTRGLVPEIVVLSWAPKLSSENFDFSLCACEYLKGTGDYLASVSVEITGPDNALVASWASIVNGMACVFLGSGTPGGLYSVNARCLTQQGRVIPANVALSIDRSGVSTPPQPVPTLPDGTGIAPNAVQIPDTSILTDDSGTPFIFA